MVNVRSSRSSHDSCTTEPARGAPTNVAATAITPLKSDFFDVSVMISDSPCEVTGCRKRSRWQHDGKEPPHCLDHRRFKEEVGQTVEVGHSQGFSSTPSSHALGGHLDANTVETVAKQTRQVMPGTLTPLPDEHGSGIPIKTEMKLAVSF
ncbi:unnamed protein product [Laminaria digitata]